MATNYNPRTVTDGLVFCVDAANPKSYPGSGTDCFDISKGGNNGTLVGGVTHTSNYFDFDGTDDVIEMGDADNFSFTDNIFSMNMWVYFDTLAAHQGVIGKRGWEYSVHTIENSSTLYFYCWNQSGSNVYLNASSIAASTWYNFCWTANGTTSILYRNGTSVSTNGKSTSSMSNTAVQLTIGRGGQASTGNAFMNGRIGTVSMYNKALTAAEVLQNFEATRGRFGV
jgi:hypothetical protein